MTENVIVSRHAAAVQYLLLECPWLADAPVLASATVEDVRGKRVFGNVPLHLAVYAASVTAIEFTGTPPRGGEYGLEEMLHAGAHLATYTVTRVWNELYANDFVNDHGDAVG